MFIRVLVSLSFTLLATSAASAQSPAGSFLRSYPGVITLEVDASDVDRRVFRVRETIPARPGPLTLLYPQWIPGNHAPTGRPWQLAGMRFTAVGRELRWLRDPADVFAFSIDVPPGANQVQAEFQYLSALQAAQGPLVVSPEILTMAWNFVVLYPAGVHADAVRVRPSVKLPAGWEFASSLELDQRMGDIVRFSPASLTELVDSPVWAGRHLRRIELAAAVPTVMLDVFADVPENLAADADAIARFRAMVEQSYKLFGPPPYRRYELLLALHDHIASHALEHQESAEIRRPPAFFTKWKAMAPERALVAHEFSHAWIGKKHRPEDLATPNYNVPMRNTLLWSYEGETEYWGTVLAARSGMLAPEQARAHFARVAGFLGARKGRAWRPLQDTTNEPIIRYDRARDWISWQRGVDYYGEGMFLWLEADARLRALSSDKRSLDDFARAFHGSASTHQGIVTYGFDDVVRALNDVAPDDWRAFLRERLDTTTRDNTTEALKAAGWRVTFEEKPSEYQEATDRENGIADFAYSLGIAVGRQDLISAVAWDSPAFKAGLSGGATLVAVNGRAYKADLLKAAITAAKASGAPISLLVKSADVYRTVSIEYRDGLRYPHLERIPDVPDRLTAILAPL